MVAGGWMLASLAACGGGGNESGPIDEILASPDSVTVSGAPGRCAIGPGPKVFVFGGQPPYKLSNSAPEGMVLDRTSLSDSGDGFQITFINGTCLLQIPVAIEDDMGRVFSVPISNQPGS